jgi:hypothetical protein
MKSMIGSMLVAAFVLAIGEGARAGEKEAKAVVDKAIKAIGGEEALAKATVLTWKTKATITLNDNENDFTGTTTSQGIDHYRAEFEGEFNGNSVKGVTVLDGKKGWRKFGENPMEMDEEAVARELRTVYIQVVAVSLVPLNGKGFKLETASDEKVGDKPVSVIKATGPDGKPFTLSFDKESGLLVKLVATVAGFNGDDYEQESTFADYKDFGGIKKATKVETKRDGNPFIKGTVTEFKASDKAAPETFAEPK